MKRWYLVAGLILAFGLTTAQLYTRPGQLSQGWSCGLNNIAATLTECAAAVTGKSYYITDIKVQTTTTTSGTYAIQSGTGTNCGSNTTVVFPKSGTGSDRFNSPITTSAMANITFITPIKITVSHAVCFIGVATNTQRVYMAGFIQ